MSAQNLVLIGVAVVAVLGAVGAFAIAFKRSQPKPDPLAGLSEETRRADRSLAGVRLEPLVTTTEELVETEADEEAVEVDVEVEEPEPTGVEVVKATRVIEVSTEEAGVSRRQFFNRAIAATFGSFLALFGIDSLAFLWPKVTGGFGADIDAGTVADITDQVFSSDGAVVPVFIPEARAYVVPAPEALSAQFEGKSVAVAGLMALFQRCVHLGCRVPWCAPSQGFECPCHGSKYNAVGEYFAGPAPRNLDRFVVELSGDRLIIKTGSIIETPRAPILSVNYPQGPSCIGAV